MFDVVVMGEALIDYTPKGLSDNSYNLLEENPGGACANLACAAAKMGAKTAFIGKVGADAQGKLLAKAIRECGVDVSAMVYDPKIYTTLAFVRLDEYGDRDFSFARKPGADTCLELDEVQLRVLDGAKIFHFGALALNADPTRSTTHAVIDEAKKRNVIVSYDANYRSFLWENELEYVWRCLHVIAKCDVIKVSEEEAELLTGCKCYEDSAKHLLGMGPSIVCLTRGKAGSYILTKDGAVTIEALDFAAVVDTTGAGDCFFGTFLSQLIKQLNPLQTSLVVIKDMAHFASAASGICVSRRGGIPSQPDLETVQKFVLKEHV